ncbi:MAG: hypothetical protein ACK4UN_16635 [Limisphaerales bacterium]
MKSIFVVLCTSAALMGCHQQGGDQGGAGGTTVDDPAGIEIRDRGTATNGGAGPGGAATGGEATGAGAAGAAGGATGQP